MRFNSIGLNTRNKLLSIVLGSTLLCSSAHAGCLEKYKEAKFFSSTRSEIATNVAALSLGGHAVLGLIQMEFEDRRDEMVAVLEQLRYGRGPTLERFLQSVIEERENFSRESLIRTLRESDQKGEFCSRYLISANDLKGAIVNNSLKDARPSWMNELDNPHGN